MTVATVVLPDAWQRAMERATANRLRATRLNSRAFLVRSVSRQDCENHIVFLDSDGRIVRCTDCKGWEFGGRERPCQHAGCVAKRLMREAGRRA